MSSQPPSGNNIALARWQGQVDEKLATAARRLDADSVEIKRLAGLIGKLAADLHEISHSLTRDQAADRFRWTKLSVAVAAIAVVTTLVVNVLVLLHP